LLTYYLIISPPPKVLLEAERDQHHHQQQEHDLGCLTIGEAYEEVISPMNRHSQEENHFSPMEVVTLSPLPTQNQSNATQHHVFNISDPLLACDPTRKKQNDSKSAKQLAWLLYLLGMIGMSFLNPLFCVLAMKYANPSILAPFSGLTLVWICLFSGMILDEFPNRRQKVTCALIVAGEVLVAFFGDHVNGVEGGMEGVVRIRI
jgi:multidrug transporter EmrE-like cation transporter